MLAQFVPARVDNTFGGYRPALWCFALLLLLRTVISLNSIFNGRAVIIGADGIPIDTFTAAGAQTVVALFALLALAQLMISLLCALVLVRYRSLIPLMFALLVLQQLGRELIVRFLPIARVGSPPAASINFVLLALMVAGLALSVRRHGTRP